jgi:hypothetical protein
MSGSGREVYGGGAGITHEESFNMSNMKDDKSMSTGGKEGADHKKGSEHKTGTDRQTGAGTQPPGQRQQSTGQPGSGGQQGGQDPNRATQQGGPGKSSDDTQTKDPGHKGKS